MAKSSKDKDRSDVSNNFGLSSSFKNNEKVSQRNEIPLMKASGFLGVWYDDCLELENKLMINKSSSNCSYIDDVENWKCLADKKKEFAWKLYSQYVKDYDKCQEGRPDIRLLMRSGTTLTVNDKVSALSLLVADNPIANINSIDKLLDMVTSKVGKRYAFICFEALKQIFISSLLPDRKLKTLSQQPLNRLPDSKDGNSLLLFWYWEECLKQRYKRYISVLEVASKDVLATLKDKAMKTIYILLSSKSEQERKLLSALVNKLGDPENKAASNANYLLSKLLSDHPNMKAVVIDNVDSFLFRPHLVSRAKYNCVLFLNQIHLEGAKVAKRLVDVYFSLFKVLITEADGHYKQKKSKNDIKKSSSFSKDGCAKSVADCHVEMGSRLLSALLSGVYRAFPFASNSEAYDIIESHVPMLFQLAHSKNFNIGVQALMLVDMISSKNQVVSDRFYRALYSKLLLPSAMNTSKASEINIMIM